MSLPDRIDQIINTLKWPCAYLAMLVLPLLVWSLFLLVYRILTDPLNSFFAITPFALGIVIFLFVWRRFLSASRLGKYAMVLEHEITHALFAVLCLHKIVGFRASAGEGGEVRFTGHGNWLITAAPYFFPTSALLLFLIAYLLPFPALPWQDFLLGVALGYHLMSTLRETRRDLSDIQRLGETFCWMFLPSANLAVIGLLVSFAYAGSQGLSTWLGDLTSPVTMLWTMWLPDEGQAVGT